jgi:hypothetical protein
MAAVSVAWGQNHPTSAAARIPRPASMVGTWSTMSAANKVTNPTDITNGASERRGMCTTARGRASPTVTTSAPRHSVGQ